MIWFQSKLIPLIYYYCTLHLNGSVSYGYFMYYTTDCFTDSNHVKIYILILSQNGFYVFNLVHLLIQLIFKITLISQFGTYTDYSSSKEKFQPSVILIMYQDIGVPFIKKRLISTGKIIDFKPYIYIVRFHDIIILCYSKAI